jgi:putative ATPase
MDLIQLDEGGFQEEYVDRPVPLAEQLRPTCLDEVIGQEDAVALLRAFVDRGELPSLIFWGPPGTGKTTMCRLLAVELMWDSAHLNATSSSVKDIRHLAERAALTWEQWEKRTIVFIDEIHRLNKARQDVLLPFLEDGTFVLLGSTTENPYFSINNALRSRIQVISLKPLSVSDISAALGKASNHLGMSEHRDASDIKGGMPAREDHLCFLEWISIRCGGDLRLAYSTLEGANLLASAEGREPCIDDAKRCLSSQAGTGHSLDNHFDLASAFQKSLRGSDVDAAVYYLARFLMTGEDPRFIARRLLVTASEDVGNRDPRALLIASAVYAAVEKLGMPEARIPLTQAAIYVAKAPKSNQSIAAMTKTMKLIEETPLPAIPDHLKDRHQPGLAGEKQYVYTHQFPDQLQDFLPEEVIESGFKLEPLLDKAREEEILHILKSRLSDWNCLDLRALADELKIELIVLRKILNEWVRNGKIEFRRQFRLK